MKTSRTIEMEKALERALLENGFSNIKQEHSFCGGRVDFYAEFYTGLGDQSVGIEIKQELYDLTNSRCGLNFAFDFNYVFVPDNLIYAAMKLSEEHGGGIGVLSYSKIDRSPYKAIYCIRHPAELLPIGEKEFFHPYRRLEVLPVGEEWLRFK